MPDWMLSLAAPLTALTVAALTPVAAGLTADRVARANARARRIRALERLEKDPLVRVGAKIDTLYIDGAGGLEKLMEGCRISQLQLGMIEITHDVTGNRMNFTGEEFEKMHPVFSRHEKPED